VKSEAQVRGADVTGRQTDDTRQSGGHRSTCHTNRLKNRPIKDRSMAAGMNLSLRVAAGKPGARYLPPETPEEPAFRAVEYQRPT
jgi:hypothetical protein